MRAAGRASSLARCCHRRGFSAGRTWPAGPRARRRSWGTARSARCPCTPRKRCIRSCRSERPCCLRGARDRSVHTPNASRACLPPFGLPLCLVAARRVGAYGFGGPAVEAILPLRNGLASRSPFIVAGAPPTARPGRRTDRRIPPAGRLTSAAFLAPTGPHVLRQRTSSCWCCDMRSRCSAAPTQDRGWTEPTGRSSPPGPGGCPRTYTAIAWSLRAPSCAGTTISCVGGGPTRTGPDGRRSTTSSPRWWHGWHGRTRAGDM